MKGFRTSCSFSSPELSLPQGLYIQKYNDLQGFLEEKVEPGAKKRLLAGEPDRRRRESEMVLGRNRKGDEPS